MFDQLGSKQTKTDGMLAKDQVTATTERIVHVRWDGPFDLQLKGVNQRSILELNDPSTDVGVYAIYAYHGVFGFGLVYIGKAAKQTFSVRVPQHAWDSGSDNDPLSIQVYVGRLCGPAPEDWQEEIAAIEALMIHAHAPPYNSHMPRLTIQMSPITLLLTLTAAFE